MTQEELKNRLEGELEEVGFDVFMESPTVNRIIKLINQHVKDVIGELGDDMYPEHDATCNCGYCSERRAQGELTEEQEERAGL